MNGISLCAVAAITLFGVLPLAHGAAPAPAQNVVRLIDPAASPSLQAKADAAFPGLQAARSAQNPTSLMSLVSNETKQNVLAFVVRWEVRHPDGSASVYQRGAMTEPEHGGALSGQRVVLPAGETHVVSPWFHWNPQVYKALKAADHVAFALKAHASPVLSGDTVTATVDAVIFEDGTFAGPNRSHFFERFRIERQGQRNENLRVRQMLSDGSTDDEIRLALEADIQAGRAATGLSREDAYRASLGRQALRLVMLLDNSGRAQMSAFAELANVPQIGLPK